MQLTHIFNNCQILFIRFCETDTWIDHDLIIGNPRIFCQFKRVFQIHQNILHKVMIVCILSVMHQTAGRICICDHLCHGRIVLQSPDIIDHICTCPQALSCHTGFVCIERNRYIKPLLDRLDHRQDTGKLLFIGKLCIALSCRFATNVYDRCTFLYHALCLSERRIQCIKLPTI